MVMSICYHLDITTLDKYKKKINVVVMDPVAFHREGLVHVLRECMYDRINITDVVSSISEIMCLIMLKGPAEIYIMEAFGTKENYKVWNKFTHFMTKHYPSVTCLIWSSKPTMFLKKSNATEMRNPCWQIPKRICVDSFIQFLTRILDGDIFTPIRAHSCIGPPVSNLTINEIVIITGVIEGGGIKSLAKEYDISYKTVSSHKRNAMIKMCILSTAQLYGLFTGGYILRGDKVQCLPIEFDTNEPFLL
jgi:DNA-binding CsgD family transcriptional regulator